MQGAKVYNPATGVFRKITETGFFNSENAYAWSMAEINGRMFVGTLVLTSSLTPL